jgi:hypothetical protein
VEGNQKKSHSLITKRLRNGRTIQASSCSWKAHNEALRNDREYEDSADEDYYYDNAVVEYENTGTHRKTMPMRSVRTRTTMKIRREKEIGHMWWLLTKVGPQWLETVQCDECMCHGRLIPVEIFLSSGIMLEG